MASDLRFRQQIGWDDGAPNGRIGATGLLEWSPRRANRGDLLHWSPEVPSGFFVLGELGCGKALFQEVRIRLRSFRCVTEALVAREVADFSQVPLAAR